MMSNSTYNHPRWEGVHYQTDRPTILTYDHSLVHLSGPNVSQSFSIATSSRERIQPSQHQPVDIVRRKDTFGLDTLALLAEQERLLAESARRVYMHHNNRQQLSSASLSQQQPYSNQIQQHKKDVLQSYRDALLLSRHDNTSFVDHKAFICAFIEQLQKDAPNAINLEDTERSIREFITCLALSEVPTTAASKVGELIGRYTATCFGLPDGHDSRINVNNVISTCMNAIPCSTKSIASFVAGYIKYAVVRINEEQRNKNVQHVFVSMALVLSRALVQRTNNSLQHPSIPFVQMNLRRSKTAASQFNDAMAQMSKLMKWATDQSPTHSAANSYHGPTHSAAGSSQLPSLALSTKARITSDSTLKVDLQTQKKAFPAVATTPTPLLVLPTKVSCGSYETLKADIQKQKLTLPVVITKRTPITLSPKSPLESGETLKDVGARRKMGRIRYFDEHSGSYGPWKDITGGQVGETESIATITLNLSRGGTLRILCNVLPNNKRKELARAMHECKLYRQYSLSRNDRLNFVGFQEPRSHVLLSSNVKTTIENNAPSTDARQHQPGYAYHGIKMKALPIDLCPEVASYAEEIARMYNVSQWSIGVDMIAYKDGGDSIGWHADDTQGETIVACVVVDAPGEVRPLCIRPNKRKKPLQNGDEEIQLFIVEGDGYDMDGYMQESYEHSLPKKVKNTSHRFVFIFRHGNAGFVPHDSGVSVLKNVSDESNSGKEEWDALSAITKLRPKTKTVVFGHISNVSVGECYPRRFLWQTFAHRADQKGINGNMKEGADSIVVSRQDFDVREEDGLSWLRYTSSRRQGGGALCTSFQTKMPVRVFRSSNLKGSYRPAAFEGDRTSYRYDGLYIVTRVWNSEGYLTDSDISVGDKAFTFHLERLPHPEKNPMSTEDLFRRIQQSRCFGPHLSFHTPQPKNGVDTLPPLAAAVAASTLIQQQSCQQSAFQRPLSVNQGARIVLERFVASTVIQESEALFGKKYVERKSKDVEKKEEESKIPTQLSRLPSDIVSDIFGCILVNEPLPQIDFQIIVTGGTKLSPPPFDYKDGIYVLVDPEFPIPHTLCDRVISGETLDLMDGRWSIGGAQPIHFTNSLQNKKYRKRSLCPKGQGVSNASLGKRGTLYTLIRSMGEDWCDCRFIHVYNSKAGKAPQVSSLPKKETPTPKPRPVTFAIKELVYAYDKRKSGGVLYEAQVIKIRTDALDDLEYWVHYKGYKKSHSKWLPSKEILKQNKLNRVMYLKSRSQSSKQSVKTNIIDNRRKQYAKTKAQKSTVRKCSKKRDRCSGSGIASENVESKRKRQSSPTRRSDICAQTFEAMEKVFAPDKKRSGDILYEATILKVKEDATGCLKYLVQYKGFKKSSNQLLDAEDLLKQTKQNRLRFEKSRM